MIRIKLLLLILLIVFHFLFSCKSDENNKNNDKQNNNTVIADHKENPLKLFVENPTGEQNRIGEAPNRTASVFSPAATIRVSQETCSCKEDLDRGNGPQ